MAGCFRRRWGSRSYNTKTEYENRIDELFKPGAKANVKGVRVLDRSDVLGMMGFGKNPVTLVENKVIKNITAHGLTASDMKKVPQWIVDTAFDFDSDTEPGRAVFIAKELVRNSPVAIIIDLANSKADAHLLINAYDRSQSHTPFNRWVRDGLLRYYDKNKSASLDRSGLSSTGLSQAKRSDGSKIYRDSDLVKYKKLPVKLSSILSVPSLNQQRRLRHTSYLSSRSLNLERYSLFSLTRILRLISEYGMTQTSVNSPKKAR